MQLLLVTVVARAEVGTRSRDTFPPYEVDPHQPPWRPPLRNEHSQGPTNNRLLKVASHYNPQGQ